METERTAAKTNKSRCCEEMKRVSDERLYKRFQGNDQWEIDGHLMKKWTGNMYREDGMQEQKKVSPSDYNYNQ